MKDITGSIVNTPCILGEKVYHMQASGIVTGVWCGRGWHSPHTRSFERPAMFVTLTPARCSVPDKIDLTIIWRAAMPTQYLDCWDAGYGRYTFYGDKASALAAIQVAEDEADVWLQEHIIIASLKADTSTMTVAEKGALVALATVYPEWRDMSRAWFLWHLSCLVGDDRAPQRSVLLKELESSQRDHIITALEAVAKEHSACAQQAESPER
jgi:hypothetical protein